MSATEIILLLTNIGGALWRLIERHDDRSTLSRAKEAADTTIAALQATVDTLRQEIAEERRLRERAEDQRDAASRRIDELEDRLYAGREQP